MDGQQDTADPSTGRAASSDAPGDEPREVVAPQHAAEAEPADGTAPADETAGAATGADGVMPPEASARGEQDSADASAAGAGAGGGEGEERRPRKPRRERPRRDPYETPFGGVFLDTLQRLAGLRGQFAYGVPEKLWRANREQTIRILREEVPMPTFKNQIHCILNSDPEWLAHDVHFEMLSSVTPPEDSFRWLWLYMMLR